MVVSNTTPIHYLALVHQIDLLYSLFGPVAIPASVLAELSAGNTPTRVKNWISNRPDWLQVRSVVPVADPHLEKLDRGERDAICLAEQNRAGLVIMDDRGGRREALRRGLPLIGTLGILERGHAQGLVINFEDVLSALRMNGFRASDALYESLLRRASGGRSSSQ